MSWRWPKQLRKSVKEDLLDKLQFLKKKLVDFYLHFVTGVTLQHFLINNFC
jgi:hypothetical protein